MLGLGDGKGDSEGIDGELSLGRGEGNGDSLGTSSVGDAEGDDDSEPRNLSEGLLEGDSAGACDEVGEGDCDG